MSIAPAIDISIIIVTFNSKPFLAELLESIYAPDSTVSQEVIVVDNASDDGTAEWIDNSRFSVNVIRAGSNLGFAAANNLGIEVAGGRYLLFLNPDTVLQEDVLNQIIRFMDSHPEVGVCGPRLLNLDGSLQRSARRFPNLFHEIVEMTYLSCFSPTNRIINSYHMADWDHHGDREVDFLIGACLCIRKSVVNETETRFDENFFMFYEETDLCLRLKKQKVSCWYLDRPGIVHHGGTSYSGPVVRLNRRVYKRRMDSRCYYYRQHHGRISVAILSLAFVLTGLVRLAVLYPLRIAGAHSRWDRATFHIDKAWADVTYFLSRQSDPCYEAPDSDQPKSCGRHH